MPGWFSGEFPVNPERLQAFGKVDSATGDSPTSVYPLSPTSGTTTRVSVASDGSQRNGSSENPSISADGRYVAFESYARNLISGDTNLDWDVFVHDRGGGPTKSTLSGLPDQVFDHNTSPTSTIDLWVYASDAETPLVS